MERSSSIMAKSRLALIAALCAVYVICTAAGAAEPVSEAVVLNSLQKISERLSSELSNRYQFVERSVSDGRGTYHPFEITNASIDYDLKKNDSVRRPYIGVLEVKLEVVSYGVRQECLGGRFDVTPVTIDEARIPFSNPQCRVEHWRSRYSGEILQYWQDGAWKLKEVTASNRAGKSFLAQFAAGKYADESGASELAWESNKVRAIFERANTTIKTKASR